ncbi:MAG: GIY-YIG nuclease family protein [Candidatus Delongbacteria bacterium]|jgi:excinuclease UvrABC nuclease subunit|nr:GIY-YIG nuclease family protein [Candidatus Delongbacteria bacterium]
MGIIKKGRPKKYYPETGEGNLPPNEPGLYRIRDESGKIVYVGETNNLRRRMREHIRTGKIKKV